MSTSTPYPGVICTAAYCVSPGYLAWYSRISSARGAVVSRPPQNSHGHGSHSKHGEAYLAYMGHNAGGSSTDKGGLSVYNAGFLKSVSGAVSTVRKPAAKPAKAYAASSHRSNYQFKPSKFIKSSRKKYK